MPESTLGSELPNDVCVVFPVPVPVKGGVCPVKNWPAECGVVIPCRNEARAIAEVIQSVRRHLATVVVVDDGSTDATATLASAEQATVLRHPRPRGKGVALATGLHWLGERGFKWALLIDGDGQHTANDLPRFFEKAASGAATMIVGNRMHQSQSMPPLRRLVNRWMSGRLSALTDQPLPDSQCGFRLLQLGVWRRLELHGDHFEIESELLRAWCAAGERVDFVPIQVIYAQERTKISPLLDTWRWVRWYWWACRGQHRLRRSPAPSPR